MNILIQNPYMQAGGAENRIKQLIEGLIRRDDIDQVHFMFTGPEASHRQEEIHNEQAYGKLHFWQIRHAKTKVVTKKIIKEFGIDIIQLHNNQIVGTDGIELGQKIGIPTMWVMHDFWPLCPQRFFTKVWQAMDHKLCSTYEQYECSKCVGEYEYLKTEKQRQVLNNCDLAVVPSERIKNIFEENNLLVGKFEVITPWIDLEVFKPMNIPRNPWQIMFAGNFIPHKGIQVLLKAMKIVQKRLPMVRLLAQGDGRCLFQTIQLRNTLKLGNVQLLRRLSQQELNKLYNESSLCIFPTIWEETCGLIWVEALSVGTPAIASAIGSIPELLKYGGVLFPPRDHVKLAEAIVDLLLSPRRRMELSKAGFEYVRKEFTRERAAEDFTRIYYRLEADVKI